MSRERSLDVMKRELWLARRLREHGHNVFDGDTTTVVRAERARAAINELGLRSVIAGPKPDEPRGRPMTYEQAFQYVFGQELSHG